MLGFRGFGLEFLDADSLPFHYTTCTVCSRREAGGGRVSRR